MKTPKRKTSSKATRRGSLKGDPSVEKTTKKGKKSDGSKSAKVCTDPCVLAKIYLGDRGKNTPGLETIRFYRDHYWRWDERRYERLSLGELRAEVTKAIQREFEDKGEGEGHPQVTTALVTNVIQSIGSITLVPGSWTQPVWIETGSRLPFISMENGLLDLTSLLEGKPKEMRPNTPKWFSTVSLPYGFNPTAACPLWENFLNTVLEGDQERINLLQEWFGYCLLPDTTEQKFLIMEGEGSNGKSIVCGILAAVLGEANVSHVPLEIFGDRFQLATTIGKLANIAPEVGHLDKVAEGYLKQFTAGDRMNFDRKGIDPIEENPTARLVLALNNRPRFSDPTGALPRRMILLPFRVTIPPERQDKHLPGKLREELSGIFNWAAEGERRRRAQGGFTESRVCSEANQTYRLEISPARQFLEENVDTDADATVSTSDLYTAYRQWSERNGDKPLPNTGFGKEVKRVFGVERRKGSSGSREYYYPGIRLVSDGFSSVDRFDAGFLAAAGVAT